MIELKRGEKFADHERGPYMSGQDAEVEAHLGHTDVLNEGVVYLRREEVVGLYPAQVLKYLIRFCGQEFAP